MYSTVYAVNYYNVHLLLSFVCTVAFVADKLDGNPKEQVDQLLKTPSTLTTSKLSPFNKERTDILLEMCAEFYHVSLIIIIIISYYFFLQSRGIVVKTCYEDFDRHNMGYVTLSQVWEERGHEREEE